MFEMSKFNMDKFVHTFVQSLALRVDSRACRKFNKITFITQIDKTYKIKQLLLYSAEKMKEINMQQNLDFSNEKSVQYFMEKHANLFDKLTYLNNTRILTSHLKNINTKILEKIRIRKKHSESIKRGQDKVHNKNVTCNKKLKINVPNKFSGLRRNSLFSMTHKEKYVNFHNYRNNSKGNKFKKVAEFVNSKLFYHNIVVANDFKDGSILEADNRKQKSLVKFNLANSMIHIAKKEIETTEKILWLYTKDIENIKRNIQVTLHIAKNSKYNVSVGEQIEHKQVLCHYAILCLIEPSNKAIVLIEDDLSVVVQKYLSHGYKHHFESQSGSKNYYAALLILSQWAKILVKNVDTTIMRTICDILRCDVQKILVLYNPK